MSDESPHQMQTWGDLIRNILCPTTLSKETVSQETKEELSGETSVPVAPNPATTLTATKPHPIHVSAAEWRHSDLCDLFLFYPHRFPIDFEPYGGYGRSLGSSFDYPLHACVLCLRRRVLEFCKNTSMGPHLFERLDEKDKKDPPLISTLRILLDHGLEPNERLEHVDTKIDFSGLDDPNEYIGFTPLQVLAGIARELLSCADEYKQNTSTMFSAHLDLELPASYVARSVEILIRYGARLSQLDPPMVRRNRKKLSRTITENGHHSSDSTGKGIGQRSAIDRRSVLNIEKDDGIINMFGGKGVLGQAQARWALKEPVTVTEDCDLYIGNVSSSPVIDCELPGGNDAKNCAICWKSFGVVRNRKHLCKLSRRYVCEDCSSKVVLKNPLTRGKNNNYKTKPDQSSHRVSDGQFNYILFCVERKKQQNYAEKQYQKKVRRQRIEALWAARSASIFSAEAVEQKKEPFLYPASISNIFQRLFADCSLKEKSDNSQSVEKRSLRYQVREMNSSLKDTGVLEYKDGLNASGAKPLEKFQRIFVDYSTEEKVEESRDGSVDGRSALCQFGGVTNSLNRTHNCFVERDEKLNIMNGKTLALKDACAKYSEFARKLKESQATKRWV